MSEESQDNVETVEDSTLAPRFMETPEKDLPEQLMVSSTSKEDTNPQDVKPLWCDEFGYKDTVSSKESSTQDHVETAIEDSTSAPSFMQTPEKDPPEQLKASSTSEEDTNPQEVKRLGCDELSDKDEVSSNESSSQDHAETATEDSTSASSCSGTLEKEKPKQLKVSPTSKNDKKPQEAKRFGCDECGYRAAKPSIVKVHMRKHTGEKPYICHLCGYKTTAGGTLRKHMIMHMKHKSFTCHHCEFRAIRLNSLRVHMREHLGAKPFACDQCTYRAAHASNLKTHKRIHTGEKPYACTQCAYKAAHVGNLRIHMRTHTGEKPFACGMCNYRASHVGHLKTHILTHTQEKPFACDQCAYKASRASTLRRHFMRTHMPKETPA